MWMWLSCFGLEARDVHQMNQCKATGGFPELTAGKRRIQRVAIGHLLAMFAASPGVPSLG